MDRKATKSSKKNKELEEILNHALELSHKLSTGNWKEAEEILDIDIEPYKKHKNKQQLCSALFLLGRNYIHDSDYKKASQACFKAYQLYPESPTIVNMLEQGELSPPISAKDIEDLLIYKNQHVIKDKSKSH